MEENKIKVEVVRIGGKWEVEFSFGVQSFTLKYGGTKAEATWMANMLRKCFRSYTASVKALISTKE